MEKCHTCELIKQRDNGDAPLWDSIYRTTSWDVVHSYDTALLGWIVLVSRRHIDAISQMTENEAIELGKLIHQVSLILEEVTDCIKTYVIQFAESLQHPHVHFHIVPRMADQPLERKSVNIFKYLGVEDSERISKEDMNVLAMQMRSRLTELNS